MITSSYILTITGKGADALFVVTYRDGTFIRLERKRGTLNPEQHDKLMCIVPNKEEGIASINENYQGRAEYKPAIINSSGSLYKQFMDAYFVFYERKNEVKPRINAVQGESLKSIIAFLKSISADDAEAVATWQTLLSNWHKLEVFYAKQMELKHINSNINTIIIQLKNGKPTDQNRKNADSHADGIRQSF